VLITGATPSALNGEKRIAVTGATTFTFDATGVSDQTATGTITAKMAPAGWEKVFSGTNKAVYRSLSPFADRLYCRVDDTGTTYARIRGYVTMSDVDTGTGPFPMDSQVNGGLYVAKASVSSERAWAVFADDRSFYFKGDYSGSGTFQGSTCFVELSSRAYSSDAYATLLNSHPSASFAIYQMCSLSFSNRVYMARSIAQVGDALQIATSYAAPGASYIVSAKESWPPPGDGVLRLFPVEIWDSLDVRRGERPGFWSLRSLPPSTPYILEDFDGVLSGRTLVFYAEQNTNYGIVIDVTGPWHD
jgi:hypothetical protein